MSDIACPESENVFARTNPRDPISYEHVQIKASIPVEKEQVMVELSQRH
jgi:hypothetical protein